MFRYRQLVVGFLLGTWAIFLFLRFTIFQEFSGLETAGNATYLSLHHELLDDFGLLFSVLRSVSLVIAVWIGVVTWFQKHRHTQ